MSKDMGTRKDPSSRAWGMLVFVAVSATTYGLLSLLPPVALPSLPGGLVSLLEDLARFQAMFTTGTAAMVCIDYPSGQRMNAIIKVLSLEAGILAAALAVGFLALAH